MEPFRAERHSLLLLSSRCEGQVSQDAVVFLKGNYARRGERAFSGMERVAERTPREREPPILM